MTAAHYPAGCHIPVDAHALARSSTIDAINAAEGHIARLKDTLAAELLYWRDQHAAACAALAPYADAHAKLNTVGPALARLVAAIDSEDEERAKKALEEARDVLAGVGT
jgi:hypothetical protein